MNLKWKAKNDFVGVPGRGFVKESELTQLDIDNLKARAHNRKLHFETFMLQNGFVPVHSQLEMDLDEQKEILEAKAGRKGKRK